MKKNKCSQIKYYSCQKTTQCRQIKYYSCRKLLKVINNDLPKKKKLSQKLVAEINNSDTSGFVLKTKCDTDNSDFVKKKLVMQTKKVVILVDLLKKLTKITKTYGKVPRIRG